MLSKRAWSLLFAINAFLVCAGTAQVESLPSVGSREAIEQAAKAKAIEQLAQFEGRVSANPALRSSLIVDLSILSLRAGDETKAQTYAKESLSLLASGELKGSAAAKAIYFANHILGLIALRRGYVSSAAAFLLESGKTPGTTILSALGPNMALAKGLADAGRGDAVIEFLEQCKTFWKSDNGALQRWQATIRGGAVPDFDLFRLTRLP